MNLSQTILLLTRPEPAARRFAAEAQATLGSFGETIISPLQRIEPLAFQPPAETAELAFTSENGVATFAARVPPNGRRAWCVGDRTAEAARRAGFDAVSAESDAAALAALIVGAGVLVSITHVAGRNRRGSLVERLRAAGLQAETLETYDQVAQPLSGAARICLSGDATIIAPLFSPRSATLLANAATERTAQLHVAAISPATAAEWHPRPGERVQVSTEPDASGVIRAMGRLFDADPSA